MASKLTYSVLCFHQLQFRDGLRFSIGNQIAALTLNFPSLTKEEAAVATKSGLTEQAWCLLPFFRACARNKSYDTLKALDKVAANTSSPGIAARTLACIADMLGILSAGQGGLRSGPGRNKLFQKAFEYFNQEKLAEGVAAMAAQRSAILN